MHVANTFISHPAPDDTDSADKAGNPHAGCETGIPSVTLTLAQRRRSRQRLVLDDGSDEVAMSIARGLTLRHGDYLVTEEGLHILVQAALEDIARVHAEFPRQLARAAYHLGNRHILLEIAADHLQFEYDSVLVDMLTQLGGLTIERTQAMFEPDVGAYGGGHRHGHDETFDEDYALAQAAYHSHEHDAHEEHLGHTHEHGGKHLHEQGHDSHEKGL